ncbi:MAG TPA: WecB/TagA/CpsF family glycosyltransferase [Terracidiphilus sp.]|nr:WecB/TagA/CpsF family glycosyltransferase [Terracidiphilus sp.]
MRDYTMRNAGDERQILGLNFYVGDAAGAMARMADGGLLVAPSAPSLKDIVTNPSYREAMLNADLVITDSALMVIVWNLIERNSVRRLSGLGYLRELLKQEDARTSGGTLWVMAGPEKARRNLDWLHEQGIAVPAELMHEAPMYGDPIEDEDLVRKLNRLRPRHVVITVGGGTQERLGYYLKRRLTYRPSIHCIGAAIAFLSGDQVHIPEWADRLYMGWFFRCLSSPRRYVPRYLSAPLLVPLLWRYRSKLPVES